MARLRLDPSNLQVTSFEAAASPAAEALANTRVGHPCTGTTCSGVSFDYACITVYDPDC
jgi:hypothetical protein